VAKDVKLTLRIAPELHAALIAEAEAQQRSLNNLIAVMLDRAIKR